MTRLLIRVEAEVCDELLSAFPHLVPRRHPASTTLTGDLLDQAELHGVLDLLNTLGIDVLQVVTIPDP